MAAPNVQIGGNDEKMRLYWDLDQTGAYTSFNLYWSLDSGMAGEALVGTVIPNVPDAYYSNKHVNYFFNRASIGVTINTEFYIRLKGVSGAGVVDVGSPGATKLIPSLSDQREQYKSAQIYGFDPVKELWKKVKVNDDGSLA